ncbi:hypothetical protein [Streptosporangium nondiastaticum]|nr:hypothetical protein [Streptosporangium nondiastaticum]
MDTSDLEEWRQELRTRLERLEHLVQQHPDATAVRGVQAQIAAVRAAAATATDSWRIAEMDDTEATVIGRALHLAYGGARIAPAVEGTALRHFRQPLYRPGDTVYTPRGAVVPDDGCGMADVLDVCAVVPLGEGLARHGDGVGADVVALHPCGARFDDGDDAGEQSQDGEPDQGEQCAAFAEFFDDLSPHVVVAELLWEWLTGHAG